MGRSAKIRKTKVIATIGPASSDPAIISGMIEAGMNVARINVSHDVHDNHERRIRLVRDQARRLGANVAVMLDTKGIEIRTGKLADGAVVLVPGRPFTLYADSRKGDAHGVAISYPNLVDDVSVGTRILLDEGKIELRVTAFDRQRRSIATEVVAGGTLRENRHVNVPGATLRMSVLAGENRGDLEFAARMDVDYVAASFMRNAEDVRAVRQVLLDAGKRIPIIAKIESREGVTNLVEIVAEADGTMVARGDLGVEMPLEELPTIQKRIIRTTVTNGKPVVTATQMLDSMERNPIPTRAEVSDVANAIFDGTSAVMLSGETAVGKYPVESVRTMGRVALEAEGYLSQYGHLQQIQPQAANLVTDAVAQAAITMAEHLNAAAIITITESGFTARTVSKYRPTVPILAIARGEDVMRKLAMNWGVWATTCPETPGQSDDDVIAQGLREGLKRGFLEVGDLVVVAAGVAHQPGSTNMIKVVEVRKP